MALAASEDEEDEIELSTSPNEEEDDDDDESGPEVFRIPSSATNSSKVEGFEIPCCLLLYAIFPPIPKNLKFNYLPLLSDFTNWVFEMNPKFPKCISQHKGIILVEPTKYCCTNFPPSPYSPSLRTSSCALSSQLCQRTAKSRPSSSNPDPTINE